MDYAYLEDLLWFNTLFMDFNENLLQDIHRPDMSIELSIVKSKSNWDYYLNIILWLSIIPEAMNVYRWFQFPVPVNYLCLIVLSLRVSWNEYELINWLMVLCFLSFLSSIVYLVNCLSYNYSFLARSFGGTLYIYIYPSLFFVLFFLIAYNIIFCSFSFYY